MSEAPKRSGLRWAMLQVIGVALGFYVLWFAVSFLTGGSLASSLSTPLILLAPGVGIALLRYRQFKGQ